MTQGNAFNGTIRMPNSAILVNTYNYEFTTTVATSLFLCLIILLFIHFVITNT